MKKQLTPRKRRGFLALASALAVIAAACALALPTPALAADQVIAHSVDSAGNRTDYTSVDAAKTAGYAGAVIVMDTDWNMGSMLEVADSKSLTIDLNGHYISNSEKSTTIFLNDHASLKLTSSAPAREFRYQGYDAESSSWKEVSTTASGLISNVFGRANPGTGILAQKDVKLTLENVAVAGYCDSGISATEGCIVNLTNTTVCHNCTDNGAGISLGDSCTVNMYGSHVEDNVATELGGGFCVGSGDKINMENGSTVSRNRAKAGGGFYFDKSFFTLKSEDKTGVIEGNETYNKDSTTLSHQLSGGGIHVDASSGNNEGVIQGLTIKGNYSAYDGGGIEFDQRWTTVKDCTIMGNAAACDGGGVYVNGSNNAFDSCIITKNYCDVGNGGYEGGGVFVSYHYDIKVVGTCIIKGNTRGQYSGNADDVYLSTLSGGGGKAYITGYLEQGSSVGVRTGIEGDRRIAKNFSCTTKNGLFIDLSGYYVSYGTDEGGDAWQRHTTKEFTVKVNGNVVGKYRNGSAVTVEAPAAEAGKAFKCWSADESTGLYPFSDYVKDASSSTLAFEMPQNDVNLTAVYADVKPTVTSVEGVAVSVAAAEDEQVLRDLLPATAQATTDAGTTVTLKVKKDGFDLGSLIQNGCVVPPAGSDAAVLEIPVESADGSVTVPEGTTVKVTVRITGNGDGDGPEVPVFPDVDYSQWYADGVAFCSGNGLMTGYEEGDDAGMFGVGRSLTRAELASILWRIADPAADQAYACDASNATGMADVADGAWYTGAANWAVKAGVVNGFDMGDHREFRPDAPVTAEQLAAILANYADPDGAAFADLGVLAEFSDADAISDWARGSVAWAKGKGVVNGYDAGYYRLLMPQEEVPRERVATILMNAFEGGVLQ